MASEVSLVRVLEVKRSRLAQAHQMTSVRKHRLPYLILLEASQTTSELPLHGTPITLAGCDSQPSPLAPGVFSALLRSGLLPSLDAHHAMTLCTSSATTELLLHDVPAECDTNKIQLPLAARLPLTPQCVPELRSCRARAGIWGLPVGAGDRVSHRIPSPCLRPHWLHGSGAHRP